MEKNIKENIGDSDKYLDSGFAVRKLINVFFNSINKIIPKQELNSVLEVACGAGFSTERLKKIFTGKDFEASDFNPRFVESAKKRVSGVEITEESIYKLKRNSDSFDLVVALEVLEHLENPDIALKEIRRVCRKYCLISVPNEPLWRFLNIFRLRYLNNLGNTPGHINHWSKKSFSLFLGKYFKVKKVIISLPWIIALVEK